MAHNWHAIIGPNGMCECGVKADGTVVTCRGLLDQEIAQLGQQAAKRTDINTPAVVACMGSVPQCAENGCQYEGLDRTIKDLKERLQLALGVEIRGWLGNDELVGAIVEKIGQSGQYDALRAEALQLIADRRCDLGTTEVLTKLLALIEKGGQQAAPTPSWQPIATAPQGQRLLLTWSGLVASGYWCKDLNRWISEVGTAFPTHWQDLPAPPVRDSKENA